MCATIFLYKVATLKLTEGYILKKKWLIIILVVILLFLGVTTFEYLGVPNGQTVESREQLLEGIPKGSEWQISTEQSFNDLIVSGIYSADGKSGVAFFEPTGNGKYKLSSRECRENDRIVISGYLFESIWYDVVWFNGAETQYAEITYTVNGVKQEPIIHDSTNMKIFINEAPAKDYSINVAYYDNEGNIYE